MPTVIAKSRQRGAAASPLEEPLTQRELEVVGLMAQGQSNPDIARALVIARPTAKTHVERVIRKLGVSDRTQAVVRAMDLGLVGTELSAAPTRPEARQATPLLPPGSTTRVSRTPGGVRKDTPPRYADGSTAGRSPPGNLPL